MAAKAFFLFSPVAFMLSAFKIDSTPRNLTVLPLSVFNPLGKSENVFRLKPFYILFVRRPLYPALDAHSKPALFP